MTHPDDDRFWLELRRLLAGAAPRDPSEPADETPGRPAPGAPAPGAPALGAPALGAEDDDAPDLALLVWDSAPGAGPVGEEPRVMLFEAAAWSVELELAFHDGRWTAIGQVATTVRPPRAVAIGELIGVVDRDGGFRVEGVAPGRVRIILPDTGEGPARATDWFVLGG